MRVHTQSFYTGRWILNQRRTKICDLVRRDSFARQACLNASAVGSRVHAGLYFPAGYVSGRKYPLVVQTHGFDPKSFWIDGSFTTAFAAQALASRGFLVLQVPDVHDWDETPAEAPNMAETLERAMDYVDGLGCLD